MVGVGKLTSSDRSAQIVRHWGVGAQPDGPREHSVGADEADREVSYWDEVGSGLYTLGGWLLTAIAVSLGAPFWFDMLNNFVNLRITGAKPATGVEMRAAAAKAQVDVHVAGPQGNT